PYRGPITCSPSGGRFFMSRGTPRKRTTCRHGGLAFRVGPPQPAVWEKGAGGSAWRYLTIDLCRGCRQQLLLQITGPTAPPPASAEAGPGRRTRPLGGR